MSDRRRNSFPDVETSRRRPRFRMVLVAGSMPVLDSVRPMYIYVDMRCDCVRASAVHFEIVRKERRKEISMFLKLTRIDRKPVWINTAFIAAVEPRLNMSGSVVTPVGDEIDYDVLENPETIMSHLDVVDISAKDDKELKLVKDDKTVEDSVEELKKSREFQRKIRGRLSRKPKYSPTFGKRKKPELPSKKTHTPEPEIVQIDEYRPGEQIAQVQNNQEISE